MSNRRRPCALSASFVRMPITPSSATTSSILKPAARAWVPDGRWSGPCSRRAHRGRSWSLIFSPASPACPHGHCPHSAMSVNRCQSLRTRLSALAPCPYGRTLVDSSGRDRRLHAFANATHDARPEPVSGAMRGLGAGGTLGGFLVRLIKAQTGSYTRGFVVLGALVFLGGFSVTIYGSLKRARLHQTRAMRKP